MTRLMRHRDAHRLALVLFAVHTVCNPAFSFSAGFVPERGYLSGRPFTRQAVTTMSTMKEGEKVVIIGGGIVGASTAYHLTLRGVKPVVIERSAVAAAASGKAGGFLAGGWGSGSTRALHEISFAMHEELAQTLGISSYRKIPTLQVRGGVRKGTPPAPWLDGKATASLMDPDTAQIHHRSDVHSQQQPLMRGWPSALRPRAEILYVCVALLSLVVWESSELENMVQYKNDRQHPLHTIHGVDNHSNSNSNSNI
ncbi:unnamed protein product, partial [Discosporangium mesarthrocarpum]